MAWPSTVNTTNLDSATDTPAAARPDLLAGMQAINSIIDSRAATSGIASLDVNGQVPAAQIPNVLTSSGGNDIELTPDSDRVTITYIVNLGERSVAQLEAFTGSEGDVAYCSDGDAGDPCLAVYDGTDWLRIALGAAISAT
jgi:hypothetical protein